VRPAGSILFAFALSVAVAAGADDTGKTALLVLENDDTIVSTAIEAALHSAKPAVRTAAARVANVRKVTAALPTLRAMLSQEPDADAVREVIRAVALLEPKMEPDALFTASSRFRSLLDLDVALALARRGPEAIDAYRASERMRRVVNGGRAFFDRALWNAPASGSRAAAFLLGLHDEAGFRGLVAAFREAHVALDDGIVIAGLHDASAVIRDALIWYLIDGYAADPSRLPQALHEIPLAETTDESAPAAFGRELLQRMLGGEKHERKSWLDWLATSDAQVAISTQTCTLFTQAEIDALESGMAVIPGLKASGRKRGPRQVSSVPVAQPDYDLPEVLPPGMAEAVMRETACRTWWIGVANVTSDRAGRIRSTDLTKIGADSHCRRAVDALLRLSLANNRSIASHLESKNVLLVHEGGTVCLDEPSSSTREGSQALAMLVGGNVTAPTVLHRVEPRFPDKARGMIGSSGNVVVTVESIISREGCVRSIRIVNQSPFPDLNAAAVLALSRWTFKPAIQAGVPVDVIFYLTINFKVP
jgi:TonB family protein